MPGTRLTTDWLMKGHYKHLPFPSCSLELEQKEQMRKEQKLEDFFLWNRLLFSHPVTNDRTLSVSTCVFQVRKKCFSHPLLFLSVHSLHVLPSELENRYIVNYYWSLFQGRNIRLDERDGIEGKVPQTQIMWEKKPLSFFDEDESEQTSQQRAFPSFFPWLFSSISLPLSLFISTFLHISIPFKNSELSMDFFVRSSTFHPLGFVTIFIVYMYGVWEGYEMKLILR